MGCSNGIALPPDSADLTSDPAHQAVPPTKMQRLLEEHIAEHDNNVSVCCIITVGADGTPVVTALNNGAAENCRTDHALMRTVNGALRMYLTQNALSARLHDVNNPAQQFVGKRRSRG
jgi:hypothetical protein